MSYFKVPVIWEMMGYLQVEADSPEDAVQKAKEMALTCPLPDGEYLNDSFEVDEEGEPLEVIDAIPENQPNTFMEYLYRDASNYKAYNYVILPGRITKEQIEEIMACLPDGESFIPSDVGLPEIRFGAYTEDDVPWFELSKDGFSAADEEPTISITPQELVDRFLSQKEKWSKEIF